MDFWSEPNKIDYEFLKKNFSHGSSLSAGKNSYLDGFFRGFLTIWLLPFFADPSATQQQ